MVSGSGQSSDVFTPEQRSAVMARVKAANTKPELKIRRLVTELGHRYRLQRKDLPGRPDLAFISRKKAIFVHGCFWHGHECKRGARTPKQNADYWRAKIARNTERDAAALKALAEKGWQSLVVWECEMKDEAALKQRLSTFLA